MKKEVFVNILNKLKQESENADKIQNQINLAFKNNGRINIEDSFIADKLYSYELHDYIINQLMIELDDTDHLIDLYVYDSDFGSKILTKDIDDIDFDIKYFMILF